MTINLVAHRGPHRVTKALSYIITDMFTAKTEGLPNLPKTPGLRSESLVNRLYLVRDGDSVGTPGKTLVAGRTNISLRT